MAKLADAPTLRYPRWRSGQRFPRWRFSWWLLFYVEDSLSRLPMLLLGPTTGAAIGSAVAVSELSSVTINGKQAAAVPSLWGVLLPALVGGISGLIVLTILAAAWGLLSYFAISGDDVWQAAMPGPGAVELRCRTEVPVGVDRLGATECSIRKPSGLFQTTDELRPRHSPYGATAHIEEPLETGTYEARFYATEHKRRIHEIARIKQTFTRLGTAISPSNLAALDSAANRCAGSAASP
jgi:hypothetical protein